MGKQNTLSATVLICFFLFLTTYAWGGTHTNSPAGWGGRAVGMGGIGVATSKDAAGMAYNPACLTEVERTRFDLGFGLLWPRRSFSNAYNVNVGSKKIWYPVPQTGYVYKFSGSDVSMGMGCFFTYGAGTEYQFQTPWFPNSVKKAHSTLGVIKLTPTVAYKINSKLSAGVTLDINYGMCKVGTPFGPAYLNFIDKADGWGYGFKVGLLYKYSDNLKFGLAYTSESNLEDLKADNVYLEWSPFSPYGSTVWRYSKAEIIDLQQPSRLAFGIAYQASKKLLLALETYWENYSDILEKVEVRLADGTGPDMRLTIPLNRSDAYACSFGIEYRLTDRFSIRSGYHYDSNITEYSSLFPIIPNAGPAHIFSLGCGYRWDNYEVDFAWSDNFLHGEWTHQSSFPIPGTNEYDNSYLDYSCNYWVLTISRFF